MPTDLPTQLRALVEATPPVTAREAIDRAETFPGALSDVSLLRSAHRHLWPIAIAASAIVLVSAGIGLTLASRSPSPTVNPGSVINPTSRPKMILTATEVHRVAASSSAASASSGTAEVTETSSENGIPQDGYDTAVTFDGANIDEKITSVPEPAGSAKSFTTDDRFVAGQFYIYTPGPGNVLEWLHDTDSANDAASMQFPDPRTLYAAIDPGAQFQVEGTTSTNGSTFTQLRALHPEAIEASALGNLAEGSLVTFEMTIDQNDVVQQMTFSSSNTVRGCRFDLTPVERKALHSELQKKGATGSVDGAISLPALHTAAQAAGMSQDCGPQTTTSQVTVSFTNLGVPQSVLAPEGAVDYQGKG